MMSYYIQSLYLVHIWFEPSWWRYWFITVLYVGERIVAKMIKREVVYVWTSLCSYTWTSKLYQHMMHTIKTELFVAIDFFKKYLIDSRWPILAGFIDLRSLKFIWCKSYYAVMLPTPGFLWLVLITLLRSYHIHIYIYIYIYIYLFENFYTDLNHGLLGLLVQFTFWDFLMHVGDSDPMQAALGLKRKLFLSY